MTPIMPVSQAAMDLGLGADPAAQLEDELKKRRKDKGTATDPDPKAYGDQSAMSAAAAALFGGLR